MPVPSHPASAAVQKLPPDLAVAVRRRSFGDDSATPAGGSGPAIQRTAWWALALALLLQGTCLAAGATARGDNGRTGVSPAGPTGSLKPAWSIDSGLPAPAWAGEARGSLWQKINQSFVPRAADDLAPVPLVADGLVVFATTRDEVRCVDRDTGQLRWSHWCAGPVRYAPVIDGDRVLVGSDDGCIHALDRLTGQSRWRVRIGPEAPWISGNGRLIPPHPVRTGLLVSDGVIYATAGLFPLEGTYLVALETANGRLRWRRNLGNVSPQGYLVEAGADLIVPNGRAAARVYRKDDGTFRRELGPATGTLAVVSGEETFAGPGATGAITGGQTKPGAKVVSYPGRHLAVTPALSVLVNEREILALDRAVLRSSSGDLARALRWKRSLPGAGALMIAGRRVYVGTGEGISVFDLESGEPRETLPLAGNVVGLAADAGSLIATTADGRVHAFLVTPRDGSLPVPAGIPSASVPAGTPVPELSAWVGALSSPRGWGLWCGPGDPVSRIPALITGSELHWIFAVTEAQAPALRQTLATQGWLGTRAAVIERRADGSVPVADHLFNLVVADDLSPAETARLVCPAPSGVVVRSGKVSRVEADPRTGRWTHQYGTAGNTCATEQSMNGAPRLQWFGGHGPERMPDRHTRGHAPLAAAGAVVSVAENGLIGTDARNGTVRWQVEVPDSMRYAMPYDAGHVVLAEDGRRVWAAVGGELWEIETRLGTVVRKAASPGTGESWGWVARDGGSTFGSSARPTAARTRKEYDLVDLEYRSGRPLVCSLSLFRLDDGATAPRWRVGSTGAWVNPTLCVAGGRVFAIEAIGPKARADRTGRLTCAAVLEDARVVCLDADTGRRLWEQPLKWPEAEDILGLAVTGDRLILSCARSAGPQAAYHLRCWRTDDGREEWRSSGLNPIHDLFHGQQVKRPVIAGDKVAFESDLFELASGRRWVPPAAAADWILKRPGHACGGMTGGNEGLLFRADNPTFFRFSDGSFTRLAPTRPGCWLNLLPVEGGVVIPEASASCVCGYPIQASLGFAFGREPAAMLPDVR